MPPPLPGTNTYQLRMPGAVPTVDDDYICTAFKLDPEKEMYITQFKVEGTADRAHHMILSGCAGELTNSATPSWKCASHGTGKVSCSGPTRILYAWAKNADGTRLPPSVGFRIGGPGKSRVKYLIIQVHYANKLAPGVRDYTGLDLEITSQPQRYIAGILLMLALPEIPPHQAVVNSDICCPIDMPVPINIFAARVHAHGLGTVVTSYKYDPETRGTELIVKGNPQWPQAFYPTTREFTMTKGDEILMRCTYSSLGKSTFTYAGLTGSDEMCNVYLMYYTDNTDIGAEFQSCGYLCNAEQNRAYPADSIRPLPSNPILEAYAIHGKMNHQLRTNSSTAASQEMPAIAVEPIVIDNTNNSSQHETSNSGGLLDHDVHHHVEMESTTDVAEPAAVTITQATKEIIRREKVKGISIKSDSQKKDDNYWSFLFFFRRFFS
ncbi:hypothetical protein DAPPUDRAFT_225477 [Daphnia pulex]|uniref:peptidylglycine monooxygenase n=1 Tax=Daphnia pulex TaxID=6669 RepID=E9GQS1_DAPPU|nr:hypothetical protein DAPPUDRAFT_225477 [Daphnia pulex]|eukprot:EFX78165.1 hypothetical protein DAPPUDRAFT_225477 [Daphnia pulex]